jgi:hypothetical protein
MRKLENYKKNSFYYELVKRVDNFAIFKQRLRPGVGCLAYEVIVIRSYETHMRGENVVQASEFAPGNEEFGKFGWSFPTLEEAEVKFQWLIKNWDEKI